MGSNFAGALIFDGLEEVAVDDVEQYRLIDCLHTHCMA
jgi:hypothetical protein